jgi:hypothetical protein
MTVLLNMCSFQEFVHFVPLFVHPDTPLELDNLNIKVKVKFTIEQAMKAWRGSRGIALLFL